MSDRLLSHGGCYVLQHQMEQGKTSTEWKTVYEGKGLVHLMMVTDTHKEYVSEHSYRVAARTNEW